MTRSWSRNPATRTNAPTSRPGCATTCKPPCPPPPHPPHPLPPYSYPVPLTLAQPAQPVNCWRIRVHAKAHARHLHCRPPRHTGRNLKWALKWDAKALYPPEHHRQFPTMGHTDIDATPSPYSDRAPRAGPTRRLGRCSRRGGCCPTWRCVRPSPA